MTRSDRHPHPCCIRVALCSAAIVSVFLSALGICRAQTKTESDVRFRELRSFPAQEAIQGVAVDANHFYAITNTAIGKYDKRTGKQAARWRAAGNTALKHLNGGVVLEGKLYCPHSNYPTKPRSNSIQIWDAESLARVGEKTFERPDGALTWVDRRGGDWWVVFAYYGDEQSVRKTELIRYSPAWRQRAAWRFPAGVVKRFAPFSNSGGSWGPDGQLYVTGHDRSEVYVLRVPETGNELEWTGTIPLAVFGQGIAWDRTDVGILYGIRRAKREVVVSRLSHPAEYAKLKHPLVWKRDPRNPILPPDRKSEFDSHRCMNPWVMQVGDRYELYYSGGDARGRQRICRATAPIDALDRWRRTGPLFPTGEKGAFDARWCVLPHVVRFNDRWRLYYTGNAGRGIGLAAFPGIGLAESKDRKRWSRSAGGKPVLAPSGEPGDPDAIGIAGGSLLSIPRHDGSVEWRFYYTGCPTIGRPLHLNQQKTICLAISRDGVHWDKRGAVLLRDPHRSYENIAVAGPVVHTLPGGGYRMWYSAIGTRWGYYSIAYAESPDGIRWSRGQQSGDNLQLAPQGDGWEKQMVEYPSVIREGDHWRMFYCGNGYGRTGIGTAVGTTP